ncbi:MAG: sodium-dependent bicarbonate transport family permease [Pseudomonadota bacterium]
MDIIVSIVTTIVEQLQKPTLAFLIGGMVLAALGSRLVIIDPIYKFIVMLLLLKVGIGAGMSISEAELTALIVPAIAAGIAGIVIVLAGAAIMTRMRGIPVADAFATVGLFGAVSASTLAAAMAELEAAEIAYEGFIGALYPFMDLAALMTAIILGRVAMARSSRVEMNADGSATMSLGGGGGRDMLASIDGNLLKTILTDTLRSPAISALLLGLALGLFAKPEIVYESFYEPLFRGLLSLLMLIMGMEAWQRLSELRKVAHAYIAYGLLSPFVHGAIGFAAGLAAHHLTGFSAGGVVLMAVMAASSSDISGPPTMRGALPEANPSAYVGTSTGLGTPVAILSIPLWMALAGVVIGF